MNKAEEIKQLEEELEQYEMAYRLGMPTGVSDEEYDKKYKHLRELYDGNIDKDSIINRIIPDTVEGFEKVNHITKMLSLDNTYNKDELSDWLAHIDENKSFLLIQRKIDGCSLSCVYRNGKLQRILTRGDGIIGEDITSNIGCIDGIPRNLIGETKNIPDFIEIRGEVYMTYDEFNRINSELEKNNEKLYANPRNLTAGTIKLLNPNDAKQRKLNFIVHSIGAYKTNFNSIACLGDFYDRCTSWGFKIVDTEFVKNNDYLWEIINKYDNDRKHLNYPTDGAVIKVDRFDYQKELGNTSKVPKWAIAYKYEAEKAKTKIKSITLQVGRTGAITPVAELEPVELSGSIVKRATCHNIDEMIARDIRIGDNIWIEKSGEIIPYIIGPVKEDRTPDIVPFIFNKKCPVCGSEAIQYPGLKHWFCSNSECPGVLQTKMEHFVSRNCLNIEDVSGAWIEKFIQSGFLKTFIDFFKLTKEQLLTLDRMGDKLADKIITNISKASYTESWRLLHAIGIEGVGKTISKDVLKSYDNDFILLYKDCQNKDTTKLFTINAGGPIIKNNIFNFFHNNKEIEELLKYISFKANEIPTFSKLSGKTICITGTHDISRDDLIQEIENLGGKVVGSVSKKTDYLLLGKEPGSKYAKAIKLGTKIITNLNEIR